MSESNSWETSVNDLIINFLSSLNSIAPSMTAARILDDKLIGYDDWGRICDNLFTIMVVEPIRESLPKNQHLHFDLPMYNTEYESLEHFSLIQVHQKDSTPREILTKETCILNCFISSENSDEFDEVEVFKINSDYKIIENSFQTYKTGNACFTCLLSNNGKWTLKDKIISNLD